MTPHETTDYGAHDVLGEQFKGLPLGTRVAASQIAAQRWNVLRGETGSPVAILRVAAVEANIDIMRRFCTANRLHLAPHAKTTLSPELIALQRAAGAWAFTAAVPHHVQLLWAFGADRVLIANEMLDPADLAWAAAHLAQNPQRELIVSIDSSAGAKTAQEAMAGHGHGRRLPVLIELGHANGRTGIRSIADAISVAEGVVSASHLRLVGVTGYEGTIASTRTVESIAHVDAFLEDLARLARELRSRNLIEAASSPVISAGGSAFFDRVALTFAPLVNIGFRVVLRSGCYLTHDHGLYQSASPTVEDGWEYGAFEPALEVWSRVISRPEPQLALLNAGRRDVSHDAGLPVPLRALHADGEPVDVSSARISGLSDQHAFLRIDKDCDLEVGDLVGLGISHPCTTFDRWRLILCVDHSYEVIGAVRTYF